MTEHRRRRRKLHFLRRLALLALTALALAGFLRWSNRSLVTDSFVYASPRLPDGLDGCRIAVLSDLHGAMFGDGNQALFDAVTAEAPDLIAVVGDLADEDTEDPAAYAAQVADGLAAIAPVYYVTGNHEWASGDAAALKTLLSERGWHVLDNRYEPLERNGDTLVLCGIDDPNGYADQKTPEELATELHADLGDPFWILLAHRNDRFAGQYSLLGADLTLSGHGHGGLVRLPFTDGLVGTNHDFFPSYTSGFYEEHGHTLFVSRGLGNISPTFRVFNRPQVGILTLTKGE